MSNTFDQMTDTCTSILNNVEHRVSIQRQLVESQRNVLETLKACNAKLASLVHARPAADSMTEQKTIETNSNAENTSIRESSSHVSSDIVENSQTESNIIRDKIVSFRSISTRNRKLKKSRRKRNIRHPKYNVNYLVRIK